MATHTCKVLFIKGDPPIYQIVTFSTHKGMLHDLRAEVAQRKQKIEQSNKKFKYVGLFYLDREGDKLEMTSDKDLLWALENSVGTLRIEAAFDHDSIVKQENQKAVDKNVKRDKKPNGFQKPKRISTALSQFLGCGDCIARTEVVSRLHKYIKEKNLQNPADRREILNDEAMRKLFGVSVMTYFSMSKLLCTHFPKVENTHISGVKRPIKTEDSKKIDRKKNKRVACCSVDA